MLYGIDISHHNNSNDITSFPCDFVIIKVTEGRTWKDTEAEQNIRIARQNGKLIGLYHYARPENNSPEAEAENFLSVYSRYKGEAICALDWEQTALIYHDSWACEWLAYVKEKTGATPFFYCQQSALKKMKDVAKAGYPLWVARYNKALGDISPFKKCMIWQNTRTPIDKNIFYGTEDEWMSYAGKKKEHCVSTTSKNCAETLNVLGDMIEETRNDMINTLELVQDMAGKLYSYKKTLEKVSKLLKEDEG